MIKLFSPCFLFGHEELIRDFQRNEHDVIVVPRTLVHRCMRCQQDLGAVLPHQKFIVRKVKKSKAKRSASVLRIQRKVS